MYELQTYRGVISNGTEEWWKLWIGIDLSFQNWLKEFDEFWLEISKVSKIYTLMGCFWPKYMFDLKKYRRTIFHDTKVECKIWRKIDFWFGKWHEECDKFSPEHTKFSKLGLSLNSFIPSTKGMSWKLRRELCVMTMKNDAKFQIELIYRGVMFDCTQDWYKVWKKTGLCFQKLTYELKIYRGVVSWQWRMMQKLKRNWLASSKLT